MHHNMAMSDDLSKAMNIFKGSRRYEYKIGDPRVKQAETFLLTTVSQMEDGSWTHYPLPIKRPRGRPMKKKRSVEDKEEDDVDQDYDDDDIDELLQESADAEEEKKRARQRRSHQADTLFKM